MTGQKLGSKYTCIEAIGFGRGRDMEWSSNMFSERKLACIHFFYFCFNYMILLAQGRSRVVKYGCSSYLAGKYHDNIGLHVPSALHLYLYHSTSMVFQSSPFFSLFRSYVDNTYAVASSNFCAVNNSKASTYFFAVLSTISCGIATPDFPLFPVVVNQFLRYCLS